MCNPPSHSKRRLTLYSKQIRPPIYSLKQSKLRKRRVIRFSILFFILFVLFIALIVGPVVGAKNVQASSILKTLKLSDAVLYQPTNGVYNDTHSSVITGTNINTGLSAKTGAEAAASASGGSDSAETDIPVPGQKREWVPRNAVPLLPRQTMYMEY